MRPLGYTANASISRTHAHATAPHMPQASDYTTLPDAKAAIAAEVAESASVMRQIGDDPALLEMVDAVATRCIERLRAGNTLFFAGNGGSAADAQHLATELVNRFAYDRPGLPAFALTTDTSLLTAIGNDYGFDQLFSRQLIGVSRPGDLLFGLSTSGTSPNVIAALRAARERGLVTVGITGLNSGQMDTCCDYVIRIPSRVTPRIQEGTILLGHIICRLIERTIHPRQSA
jgi:D-sedoheptulose 7-phosphate isomerase